MGKKKKPNKFWEMKMSADKTNSADIFIYGEITQYAWEDEGEVSSTSFKKELDALGQVTQINLHINSPGGSVFEGVAIHNMLMRHKANVTVYVDGLAASIASVIAMAGNKIRMPVNAMMMVHNPLNIVIGNAIDLRKAADDLDRIGESAVQSYLQKAGDKLDDETLKQLLAAETWLSADQAFQYGLCDVVEDANQMVASISEDLFEEYKNVPTQLQQSQPSPGISAEDIAERIRLKEVSQANLIYLATILGGTKND